MVIGDFITFCWKWGSWVLSNAMSLRIMEGLFNDRIPEHYG